MSVEKRVTAFLDLAVQDLDAAELLARAGNRYAAYHVQQAVEKMIKAILVERGIPAGREHRIEVLLEELPVTDAAQSRFEPWVGYSVFATSFRYPSPGGKPAPAPASSKVLQDVRDLRVIEAELRERLTS